MIFQRKKVRELESQVQEYKGQIRAYEARNQKQEGQIGEREEELVSMRQTGEELAYRLKKRTEFKGKYQIVIVEDDPKHLKDVKELIDGRLDLVDAYYATNLEDALQLLNSKRVDGVLSDAHFPESRKGPEAPCGIQIIDYAMENRIPFTIVTSTYHHGTKTEPVNLRSRGSGMELVDFNPGDTGCDNDLRNTETDSKRWDEGLATLVYLIDAEQSGQLTYGPMDEGNKDNRSKGYIGMQTENGNDIKFLLPSGISRPGALDEVKYKLRLSGHKEE